MPVSIILGKLLRMAAGLSLAVPMLGCTPARLLNAVVSKDGYRLEQAIAYGQEERQKLDVYIPDQIQDPPKTVVFFYGGRWEFGSRNDYLFVGQALAAKGIITVVADYRLYPKVMYPAFLEDAAKSVSWARDTIATYGGDPDQLYLMGHSAGAYIATMLALDEQFLDAEGMSPTDLAGVIGLAGPYDFLPIKDPVIKEVFDVDPLIETQPIHHAATQAPPFFLMTGDDDVTVLPRNTKVLAEAINTAGGDATTKTYESIAHVGIMLSFARPFRWLAPVLDDVTDFMKQS